ncbi:MAG TPA: universal stress protein [Candidatus Binatia bacterium]|jgi:nucleotide-binding universal stress UspA family protein
MPANKYLVPVDFSKSSVKALRYAAALATKSRNPSLLVLHVITESAAHVPFYLREKFYAELEQSARKRIAALLKRNSAMIDSRIVLLQASDPAEAISGQAKKSRVSMIVMGSHGKTGLKRLVLGSVAEKILSSVACPVLIIK